MPLTLTLKEPETKTEVKRFKLQFDTPRPLTVHVLLAQGEGSCNFKCSGCFYRREDEAFINYEDLLDLIDEWASKGVRSIALGGGEPTEYGEIFGVVEYIKRRGLFCSMTTNGSRKLIFPPGARPDRIHISWDRMHEPEFAKLASREDYMIDFIETIEMYQRQGITVGINHIVTDLEYLENLAIFLDNWKRNGIDNITLLMEKPVSQFQAWGSLERVTGHDWRHIYWYDACLRKVVNKLPCKQGVSSFCVSPGDEPGEVVASRCSNVKEQFLYTTLEDTWSRIVQSRACLYE